MTDKRTDPKPDERVTIPLDPEAALRGLLKVDPESAPAQGQPEAEEGAKRRPDSKK